jgi:hypothetical protein
MSVGREPARRRKRKRKKEIKQYENQRKLWDTRWTPNTEELRELVGVAVNEAGSVLALSRIIGMKYRHLRRVYHGESKAVSYRIADQILARSRVAYRLQDLPWLTVEELVDQGIWSEQKTFLPSQHST